MDKQNVLSIQRNIQNEVLMNASKMNTENMLLQMPDTKVHILRFYVYEISNR